MQDRQPRPARRDFLRTGAALSGLVILGASAKGAGRALKVGLIGCGGRGRGALQDSVEAAKFLNERLNLGINHQIAGVADWFPRKAEQAGQRFGVAADRCFGGPTGYQRLLETDVEIVLMAEAPAFRPIHLEAAVRAGKHVFIEKPVAIDPPGCRRVIEAGELARQKNLCIVAGTEMRHVFRRRLARQALTVERAWGKLLAGRVGFAIAHMFHTQPINPRTADDLVGSWQDWVCLSGDHIVEQHVHNIDIANWFAGHPPVSAAGFGGRARRRAGTQYDFFSIDFDYGEGVHVHSMCRQVNGCWNWVGHDFVFEGGRTDSMQGPAPKESPIPEGLVEGPSEHHQEQIDTLWHVARGVPINQARDVAESSAAAVLGRTSAYTGQLVTWRDMMGDPKAKPDLYNLTLRPTAEDFERGAVEMPQENVVPIPGSA